MKEQIVHIAQGINRISRLAVIENATATEQALNSLAKLIKYRYADEGKLVVATREIQQIREALILPRLLAGRDDTLEVIKEVDLHSVFLPHYSISGIWMELSQYIPVEARKVSLQIEVKEQNQEHVILFRIEGDFDVMEALKTTEKEKKETEYGSIQNITQRWSDCFGQQSIQIESIPSSTDYGKGIEIRLLCK